MSGTALLAGRTPPLSGPQKGRTEVGDDLRPAKPRASDLGEDAEGKLEIQGCKIDALSNESPSEQGSLLGVAEFNIKGDVIDIDCCCFEFAWLDSMVVQPCAHIAQE